MMDGYHLHHHDHRRRQQQQERGAWSRKAYSNGDKSFHREAFGLASALPRPAALPPLDYAEIFASSCSIPVLHLPPPPKDDIFRSSSLDYHEIFGGFDSGDFGVSYEEILLLSGDGSARNSEEISGSGKKWLNKDNDTVFLNGHLSSNDDPQRLSSSLGIKEQRNKGHFKAEKVDGNGVCDAQLFGVDGACAKCELPSVDPDMIPTFGIIGNSVPLASCDYVKSPDNGRSFNHDSNLKTSGPTEDAQMNEQYHSCSSSEKSAFEDVGSLLDCSDNSPNSNVDVTSVSVKEANSRNVSSYPMPFSSESYLYSELMPPKKHSMVDSLIPRDVCSSEALFGNSSMNQSSATADSFISQSTTSCWKKLDSVGGIVEKYPASASFTAEKVDGSQLKASTTSEDGPSIRQQSLDSCSNFTAAYEEKSNHSASFFKVSDINLLTEPCQVPPPSRPPPKLGGTQGYPKVMMAPNKQKNRSASEIKTCNETAKQEEPSFFDVEVNAGSTVAASVAAMKEAIELAELQLRSAKGLMDRTKESFHRRKKSAVTEAMNMETKVEEPILVDEMVNETIIPDGREKCQREWSTFVIADSLQRPKVDETATEHLVKGEKPHTRTHSEESMPLPPKLSFVHQTSLGQWKVGEQFYEFVNDDMNSKRVPEIPDHESDDKRSEVSVATIEVENIDTTECKLTEMQNDCSVEVGTCFELDHNDDNAKTKYREFSIVPEVDGLKVEPKFSADVSFDVNDDMLENTTTSLQQDLFFDDVNAESQKFMTKDNEENEVNKTYHCEGFSTGEHEGNNVDEFLESCILKENNDADSFVKVCMLDEEMLNIQPAYRIFELQEIVKQPESPMQEGCTELNKDEFIGVGTEAMDETYYHEEEVELTSEESEVVSVKDEYQAPGDNQEDCEHKDEAEASAANIIFEPSSMGLEKTTTNTELHSTSGESLSCSLPEQEELTKEPCWQYFCEKLIGKTERFHESNRNQVDTNLDELKFTQSTQTEFEKNHGDKPNYSVEDNKLNSVQDEYACKLQGDGRLRSEEANCSENVSGTNDGRPNMLDEISDNASKIADRTAVEKNEIDEKKNISMISESDKLIKEENTRELGLEKERLRKLEEQEKEREENKRELELEKERMRKLEEQERERENNKRELELEKERLRKLEEEQEREREREKDRQAVDGPNRGSRERAVAEAQERAERVAVERATVEARQRALAEAREKAEKASNEALLLAEKASREAKLRAERAAVERATAEARERAVERALAEKAAQEAKERTEGSCANSRDWQRKENGADYAKVDVGTMKNTGFFDLKDSREPQRYSTSSSSNHVSKSNDKLGGHEGESAMRCKARLERHQRTVERAAKALAEKNLRDSLVQREQAERNRLADTLDADVRRWSNGKEGNLRALLATLQYILGPESGWKPITLTEVLTAAAVKKAYRKATLCVHPDKLQQRGASIQQKYICEKVFDLLKEAWSRFNSEER